ALEYKGLIPKGTPKVNMAELAKRPDPAARTYELLRAQRGEEPSIQPILNATNAAPGAVLIPNMTGWPMREAVKQAAELGLVPAVHGSGLLSRQVPSPGQSSAKGMLVDLYFQPPS
ncbi:MAG TPA: PASTA domain-containing protein, partial [Polyangiaceae bacterium]